MSHAVKFKHTSVPPRQPGEVARLKVVQGPDSGAFYVITGHKITIGRGEENDVIVLDLKASRKHAELIASVEGWILQDSGSANGVLHNGKATRSAKLKAGDTITLGESTLEFFPSDVGTAMLVAPARTGEQVQAENSAMASQKKRVQAGFSSYGVASHGTAGIGSIPIPSNPVVGNKNMRLIWIALGGAALYFYMSGDSSQSQRPSKSKSPTESINPRDLASYLPEGEGVVKTAEMFFKTGFRDYRERNYIRAKSQFEMVLQISPSHKLATIYLENCNKQIEDEVKFHLSQGKKGIEAGKLKSARGHFEAVLRLLYRDPNNTAFAEAKGQLDKMAQDDSAGRAGS